MATNRHEDSVLEMAEQIKQQFTPEDIQRLIGLIEPGAPSGEMTAEEFDHLMQTLQGQSGRRGYSDKSIAAARQVLVMGAGIAEAAAATGLTRQGVDQLMKRIERRRATLPAGWSKVDEWFPESIARSLRDVAEQLQEYQAKGLPLEGVKLDISGLESRV